MKNLLKNLLILSTVFSLVFLFSCGDEDPEDDVLPDAPSATVDVKVNGTAATSPATVEAGDEITADLDVTAPGTFNVFRVFYVVDGTTVETAELLRTDVQGVTDFTDFETTIVLWSAVPDSLAGHSVTFEFEIVDDASQTGTTTADFVLEVDLSIEIRSELLFGAQGNSEPGFYNVGDNVRYNYANARDNSASVDFAYYWGATNENTIAAIDDEGLNAVYTAVNLPIKDIFAERNATRFIKTDLSVEEYTAITSSTELQNAATFEVGGTSSANQLEEDDIIAYQLIESRGGSFGLIRIVSIDDTNGNGTIEIEVRSQIEE